MKTCRKGHQREDGILNCPVCRSARYQLNREKENASNKIYREEHKTRLSELHREHRESHPEEVKTWYENWVKENPVHSIWRGMKNRCYSTKNLHYAAYGGRGITVCERWLGNDGYKNFEADMGPRPSTKYTLERENNEGNYEPGNCVWATRKKQQRNRRTNHLLTIGGITKCMTEWAEENRLNVKTLQKRLDKGWPESKWLIPANQNYRTIGNTGRIKSVA